jgi:hypothetical protein
MLNIVGRQRNAAQITKNGSNDDKDIASSGKNVKKLELQPLLAGRQNSSACFVNSLAVV